MNTATPRPVCPGRKKVLADAKTVENPFDAYAANPFVLPQGRPVALQDLIGAAAAIYVISRISGEGKDRTPTAGGLPAQREGNRRPAHPE